MLRFLGLRVAYTLAVLIAVSMLVFAVTELLPGNVVTMILGTDATPQDIARLERLMGLSDPPATRYLHWASGVARGDTFLTLIKALVITAAAAAGVGAFSATPCT